MEFIIEIYNFLIDTCQYIFGIPEGITYALFGIRKKKKKAKKEFRKAQRKMDEAFNDPNGLDSIPQDEAQLGGADTSELIDGEAVVGEDIPNVPHIPEFPYLGKQIILNSGRLHLNANTDFILINSAKSVSIAAPGSVNVDTEGAFIVNANVIKLGIGEESDHPLVYGDVLIEIFNELAASLQKVQEALALAQDSSSAPIDGCKVASTHLKSLVKILDSTIETLTSKQNFTK
tara:strand:- start:136 stop:831 length:696 start_codon:yes stop_codon:yes gene_type:complete